ncbi:MAG: methionyl-tRNA formyltransferase [Alphaproteobacteria bacterium]|nr:MAG: methionyl-tRNA formyltransferase [Alphaproteobacteria bacterium]
MRLAFMGTPDFSAHVLKALLGSKHDVVCVYSQPPRPAGRGKKLVASPVQSLAETAGIEVRTPISLKGEEVQAEFAALDLDAAIVVAYGLILPKAVLDAPRFGCLNLHASLLPRWRGAAPIQRAIMAGDAETGIAVMQMAEGLDTGDILSEARLPIGSETTAGSLHDALVGDGVKLLLETLPKLGSDALIPRSQDETGVTYAEKISKAEAAIDWTRPAIELDRHIRGLNPAPGAYFEHDGIRIKILSAKPEAASGTAGILLDDNLLVACGEGALRLNVLQRAGKSAMPAKVFLNGHPIAKGESLL